MGVAVVLTAALILSVDAARGTPPTPTANVTAHTLLGQRLVPDPPLRRGEVVVVEATGFAPASTVTVGLPSGNTSTLHAAPRGDVDLIYIVPPGLADGQYVISFSSAAVGPTGTPAAPVPGTPIGRTALAHVVVGVPEIGVFPFVVGAGGGSPSPSPTPTPTPTRSVDATSDAVGSTSMSAGGTAYTGADIAEPLLVGLLALLVGAALVVVNRRRSGRHGPTS